MGEKKLKEETIKILRESLDVYEKSDDEIEAIGLLLRQVIALIHAESADSPYDILGRASQRLYIETDTYVRDALQKLNEEKKDEDN